MRSLPTLPLLGIVLLHLLHSAHGQIRLDLARTKHARHGVKRHLQPIDLANSVQWGGSYRTQINVGNPAQSISIIVTTGTQDVIWLPAKETCENTTLDNYGPCFFGGFDANASRTFDPITDEPELFREGLSYKGESSFASGIRFNDDIRLGNISLSNLTMGYADNVTNGVIPSISFIFEEDNKEQSFLYQMWHQEYVPTLAYSIWLGSQNAQDGQLYFGAIDTSKYQGNLISFGSGDGALLTLPLTSVTATSSTGTDELNSQLPIDVILSLGSPISYLPQDLAFEIWAIAGVQDVVFGIPFVPCSHQQSDAFLTLGLGGENGAKINISMSELVQPKDGFDYDSGVVDEDLCAFGITNATDGSPSSLGDHFFRSAYTVVDRDNRRIAIAPALIDADPEESSIVAFDGNGAPIPSASVLSDQPTFPLVHDDDPRITDWTDTGRSYKAAEGFALSLNDSASSASGSSDSGNQGLATGAKAGIGVGAAVIGLIILGGGLFLLRRRRGARDARKEAPNETGHGLAEKPELSGHGIHHSELGTAGEHQNPVEFQGSEAAPVAPVEIGGRERPAEMEGDKNGK
ncbi:hypothetical protein F66182_986 [Fusarium sp. NRRL 66182]|nr:hypothetical protein F66182_986 [Fusarium sp. NRRL 66182]